jgi:iron complex transport system substrate-binding protein
MRSAALAVPAFLAALTFGCAKGEAPAVGSGSGETAAAVAKQRLVALTPSATEIVWALGATDQLVGVTDYAEFPPEVKVLPKTGTFIAPNLETIVRLKPTLVIVDDIHGQAAGALRDAHLATVECPMHGVPDIKAALHAIGDRIGKAKEAATTIAAIDKALDDAAAHRPARHPRVLVVIDREAGGLGTIVAAGPGSYVDELLAVVGGDNVLAGAPTRYPKISVEEVLRSKPEVILDLSYAARDGLAPWQALDVPAVKAGRIVTITDAFLIAPSPRISDALNRLEKVLASPG